MLYFSNKEQCNILILYRGGFVRVSTKGRYALRLMLDLACHNTGEYITLKEISERQDISLKYLEQIITLLNKAGFLYSTRGAYGGYKLSKSPKEYTVGEILRITEGNLAPVACLDSDIAECFRSKGCATRDFWLGLYDVVNNYINNTTLEDLVNRQNEINQNEIMSNI